MKNLHSFFLTLLLLISPAFTTATADEYDEASELLDAVTIEELEIAELASFFSLHELGYWFSLLFLEGGEDEGGFTPLDQAYFNSTQLESSYSLSACPIGYTPIIENGVLLGCIREVRKDRRYSICIIDDGLFRCATLIITRHPDGSVTIEVTRGLSGGGKCTITPVGESFKVECSFRGILRYLIEKHFGFPGPYTFFYRLTTCKDGSDSDCFCYGLLPWRWAMLCDPIHPNERRFWELIVSDGHPVSAGQ